MSPAHRSTRNPAGPPPRVAAAGKLTMAELTDGLRIMAGLPPLSARCGVCGGQDWRW